MPPSTGAAAGTILASGTFEFNGSPRPYHLLRLPTATGEVAFAQWIPPLAGKRPAVLLAQPYDGIDWTQLPVDETWAQRCPQGCSYPDTDGPGNSQPDAGINIAYQPMSPATMAGNATIWLLNDMGVLAVFGRFYAGGSLWTYVQSMVAGLRFLQQQPEVDPLNLSVWGASLGGFESFYAAAYAPEGARPTTVLSVFPPVDLPEWESWVSEGLPEALTDPNLEAYYARFFDPYLRRLHAATGGPPGIGDYGCFSRATVVPRVTGEVLLLHDEWDALVPFDQSVKLAAALGQRAKVLYHRHEASPDWDLLPPTHGPINDEPVLQSYQTFAMAWFFPRAQPVGDVIIPWVPANVRGFLNTVRDQQRSGLDRSEIARRLVDLAHPRLVMFDLTASVYSGRGAEVVAAEVNAVWGTSYTAQDVAQGLSGGLPP